MFLIALPLVACGEFREAEGVYIERAPIGADRDHALRVGLFEFGNDIGGFVEYYEIGGVNSNEVPYVRPASCVYWGPLARLGDEVRLEVGGPDGMGSLVLEFHEVGRSNIQGAVLQVDGAAVDGGPIDLDMRREPGSRPDFDCRPGVTILPTAMDAAIVSEEQ